MLTLNVIFRLSLSVYFQEKKNNCTRPQQGEGKSPKFKDVLTLQKKTQDSEQMNVLVCMVRIISMRRYYQRFLDANMCKNMCKCTNEKETCL